MNIFDILIAALLIFAFYKGFMKGLFVEVASLVALVGGVYVAIHFSYLVSEMLEDSVSWNENYVSIAAFAITFAAFVIVVSMLGKALTKIADFAALGFINKAFGGVFGLLKSALILSVVFIFFSKVNKSIPFVKKETLEASILYEPVKSIVPMIFPSLFADDDEVDDEII